MTQEGSAPVIASEVLQKKREAKRAAKAAAAAAEHAEHAEPSDRAFRIGDHVELGRALIEDLGGRAALVHDELHTWRHSPATGLWSKVDRAEESRIVQSYSGAPVGEKKVLDLKASDVSGAIKLASDQVAKPGFFRAVPSGIAFSNGFVKVSKAGAELEPLEREHRARAGYPFAYDPAAVPTEFLAFLDGVFRDDDDKAEKVSFVQEFFGACILGIAPTYQRCVYAIGEGDNGKSRVADIVLACFPEGTTSAIPPQDFGQEYRRALLVGVRLNAVGELPPGDIVSSEAFKAIVAGDPIVARIIRESPVMFRPTAGHYFAANKLPGSTDHTDGFWRRPVVLTFNRSFKTDPTRDPEIHTRIIAAEQPAIVSWLVAGAARLVQATRYTIPPSHEAALAKWRKEADQVALFVEADTRPDNGRGTGAADLYGAYAVWAQRNGHRAVASNTFGQRMQLLGLASRRTKHGARYPVSILSPGERFERFEGDEGDELVTGF